MGQSLWPIIGLKLGPQNLVILNDHEAVAEYANGETCGEYLSLPFHRLFDRRGGIYSSRPPSHIANDLIFQNSVHPLFLPYGDAWRQLRKALQDILRTTHVDDLLPLQDAEATQTLYDLLHTPDSWYDHIRRYSTAVILASVFGLRGASYDSPRVKRLYEVQNQNTAINELGATPPIDAFPFLKSLPGPLAPWRKWALDIRVQYRAMLFDLVKESKENSRKPGGPDCFLAKLHRDQEKSGLDDEHVAYLGGGLVVDHQT